MIIKSLELSNYRNYDTLSLTFDKGINILYGDNAQGKTNILEAMYLSSTTKSHRGSKDREIIQLGQDESHIRLVTEKEGISHKIDMHLKKNKPKGIAMDGIPIRKSGDLLGFIHIVFFSPEDLSIIKNGPGERRRFIDMELCQLDKVYLYNLSKYNKIVVQRNNLLKQIGHSSSLRETLEVWDEQLVTYGREVIKAREQFINQLNAIIYEIHKKLSGGREELIIQYEPNVACDVLEEKIKKSIDRDLQMKMTTIGPHRDDIVFLNHGVDLRRYGSQGQQRTSALSLKLSEIELVRKVIKDEPILLLDDVLSELDRNRQTYLLDSIDNIQTFVTCTGLEEFVNQRIRINKTFEVKENTVKEQY